MARNKREIGEINAGSMADIAFLLLIFYLVTSTIAVEEGILRLLPPMEEVVDPPPVKERNVFEVLVNRKDQLLVEGDEMKDVTKLKDAAIEFMTNPNNASNLPVKRFITKEICEINLAAAKAAANQEGEKKWQKKLNAVNLVGEFWEEPNAVISLQNDRGTSYGKYVAVQNQLQAAVNELRNKKCLEAFGIPFSELDSELEEDKPKVLAIREVIPQRISEAEPKNVQVAE